jgi:RNA polymerase sigma-70 factor (ECF subfamily)
VRESRQRTTARPAAAPASGAPADAAGAEVDPRLVEDMRGGDARGLAGLYDRHADRGDAEDLVHDVFIEAWNKAASFSLERGGVRTWLLVRVRSRAIDRLRSLEVARRHARHGEQTAGAPPPPVAGDPAAHPDHLRARAALAACDTPIGTVKSRLLAGMRELRRRFDAPEVRHGAG